MKKVLPFFLLSISQLCLAADTAEPWKYPDPGEMIKASNTLCEEQSKSAMLAWQLARKGQSREEVLALVPEPTQGFPLRLTSAMRENIEDAFAYAEISQYSLFSFRSQVCKREVLGALRMPRLAAIKDDVLQCQQAHGTDRSSELARCIQAAIKKVEPQ